MDKANVNLFSLLADFDEIKIYSSDKVIGPNVFKSNFYAINNNDEIEEELQLIYFRTTRELEVDSVEDEVPSEVDITVYAYNDSNIDIIYVIGFKQNGGSK